MRGIQKQYLPEKFKPGLVHLYLLGCLLVLCSANMQLFDRYCTTQPSRNRPPLSIA